MEKSNKTKDRWNRKETENTAKANLVNLNPHSLNIQSTDIVWKDKQKEAL